MLQNCHIGSERVWIDSRVTHIGEMHSNSHLLTLEPVLFLYPVNQWASKEHEKCRRIYKGPSSSFFQSAPFMKLPDLNKLGFNWTAEYYGAVWNNKVDLCVLLKDAHFAAYMFCQRKLYLWEDIHQNVNKVNSELPGYVWFLKLCLNFCQSVFSSFSRHRNFNLECKGCLAGYWGRREDFEEFKKGSLSSYCHSH